TPADDVWSLGITFLDILSGGYSLFANFKREDFTAEKVLLVFIDKFSDQNRRNTITEMINKNPLSMSATTKNNIIELIDQMLVLEANKRINLDGILNSKLFAQFKNQVKIIDGISIQPMVYKSRCDIIAYQGFDYLVRCCLITELSTETFFLAVDIFHRALSYEKNYDYANIIFLATIALYMATKMIESDYADPTFFVSLSTSQNPLFTEKDLIVGETAVTNLLYGIIYPHNLFTYVSSGDELEQAFDMSRNCFLYGKYDMR